MTIATVVSTERELVQIWESVKQTRDVALDTEFYGPLIKPNIRKSKTFPDTTRAKLAGYSLAWRSANGELHSHYVPLAYRDTRYPAANRFLLAKLLKRPGLRRWWHNWKADAQVLRTEGLLPPASAVDLDTMVAAWLVGDAGHDGKFGLKSLALKHGLAKPGEGERYEQLFGNTPANLIPPNELGPYAANDTRWTFQLAEQYVRELVARGQWERFATLESHFVRVLRHMERAGIAVDRQQLLDAAAVLTAQCTEIAGEFERLTTTAVWLPTKVRVPDGYYKNGNPRYRTEVQSQPTTAGASVSSDRQVARWLWDELELMPVDWPKTSEGQWSVAGDDLRTGLASGQLSERAAKLVQLRLDYQARSKLRNSFTTSLVLYSEQHPDGRIRGSIHHTGTATNRLSMSGPNLQQLPRPSEGLPNIRAAFVPKPGWELIVADQSQLELRLVAHLSRDERLIQAYRDGADIHEMTRVALGIPQRAPAKIVNFSTIYRISPPALAVRISLETGVHCTPKQAKHFINAFFDRYPGVRRFHGQAIEFADVHGYARSIGDFRRDLRPFADRRHYYENIAINTPVQASAGDLMKLAMVQLYGIWGQRQWLGKHVNLLLQVHDELVVEASPTHAAEVAKDMKVVMESSGEHYGLRVPLVVSPKRVSNWAEGK